MSIELSHLEWFIEEPIPGSDATLFEILPYSPRQADRIIQHLFGLAKINLGRMDQDGSRAIRVREAFRMIVDAAGTRQAQLDLAAIERHLGKAPWRDRLRDLRNDRRRFATAIGDKSARAALRWAVIDIGQASRAGRRWSITCATIRRCCGGRSTGHWKRASCNATTGGLIGSIACSSSRGSAGPMSS